MPKEDQKVYVQAVLNLYRGLPDTPARSRRADRQLANELYCRGVDLEIVEVAMRLATARRQARPADAEPLSPVRSLHYFLPLINEMPEGSPPEGYLDYLRQRESGEQQPTETITPPKASRLILPDRWTLRQLCLPLDLGECPEKDVFS